MLDRDDRVLLFRHPTPADTGAWITPGGAVEAGETEEEALRRELREELHAEPELGPWIWRRRHVWSWAGAVYETRERIALVRVAAEEVRPDPSDSLFSGAPGHVFDWRWWTLAELRTTRDELAPRRLATLAADVLSTGPPRALLDAGV